MDLSAPPLPEGREVALPGRGTTFIRHLPGPVGAPVLLLLHGLGATADLNWYASFAHLGRGFRVVAMDHRGHGRGIRSPRRFRLEDCADDAAALAGELGIDRLIAVGYSMGGPISQLLWHRHPGLVAGLVQCATARNFRGSVEERLLFGLLGGASVAARVAPRPLLRRLGRGVFPPPPSDDPASEWAQEQLRRHHPRMVLEAARAVGSYTSHRWIERVDVPTAVVITKRDQLVPPRRQRKLAEAIPTATVHEVEGDHFVCATAPDRFVPILYEACASVARRAGLL